MWMQLVNRLFARIFFVAFMLLSACTTANDELLELNCSTYSETFFRKPTTVQMAEFSDYSVKDEYALYICGSQVREPPSIHLAIPFAKKGKAAVGLLRTKLAATRSDLTIRDILFVFEEMERLRSYDVASDDDLMKLIDVAVDRVKDPVWKKQCEQSVKEIRNRRQAVESIVGRSGNKL
jgi:hypothetical protein